MGERSPGGRGQQLQQKWGSRDACGALGTTRRLARLRQRVCWGRGEGGVGGESKEGEWLRESSESIGVLREVDWLVKGGLEARRPNRSLGQPDGGVVAAGMQVGKDWLWESVAMIR